MATQQSNARAAKIRMIQVARRQLGLDDETYRRRNRLGRSGQDEQRRLHGRPARPDHRPLEEEGLQAKEASRRAATAGAAHAGYVRRGQQSAGGVAVLLAEIGAVRDPSESALNAYVRRQAGVDDLAWVRDMEPVIEGLKAWAARKLPAAIQARMEELVRAGVSLPWASVRELARSQAPKRSPNGFEALLAAWRRVADAWPSVMTRSQVPLAFDNTEDAATDHLQRLITKLGGLDLLVLS